MNISNHGQAVSSGIWINVTEYVAEEKIDEIVKTQNWDGKVKSFRCKARKS